MTATTTTTISAHRTITAAAAPWLPIGIVPCEAIVVDRGRGAPCGCRYCVELSHARADRSAIMLGEFGSRGEADRFAAETEKMIDRLCDEFRKGVRPCST